MNKELKLETRKKAYVSVRLEIYTLEISDIVTASVGEYDVTQDDIFD